MEQEINNTGYEQQVSEQQQYGYPEQQYTTGPAYREQPQQQQAYYEEAPRYTAADLLGQEFAGTRAASFKSIEDLAKSYNNLVSLMGSRLEDLPPAQKAEFAKAIGISGFNVPKNATEYKIDVNKAHASKYADSLKTAAYEMRLSQEQATDMAELLEGFGQSIVQNIASSIQQKALGYIEASKKAFGDKLNSVVQSSEYVAEKIIPHVCGMSGEAFFNLLAQHGLVGHPAILALLNHVGSLYAQGRGSITGGIPAGTYTTGGNDLSFYQTPQAQRILANKQHSQYKEYYNGLIEAATRAAQLNR